MYNSSSLISNDITGNGTALGFQYDGREYQLAMVLGWAAERDIPFHEALATLTQPQTINRDAPAGKTHWLKRSLCLRKTWNWRLTAAAADLRQGQPLSTVLDKRFRHSLSPYFLAAVAKAELDNSLATVLPQLAMNARFTAGTLAQFKAAMKYPCTQFFVLLIILSGLYSFIIPKLAAIFREMSMGAPLPPLLTVAIWFSEHIGQYSWLATVFLSLIFAPAIIAENIEYMDHIEPLLIVLQFFFFWVMPFIYIHYLMKFMGMIYRLCRSLAATYLPRLPLLGKPWRKLALFEAAGAMHALLGAGFDIVAAARWNADTVSNPWLRRKFAEFATTVENGGYWADAWEKMRLGTPAHNWLIHNAARREKPHQGFGMLTQWLSTEIRGNTVVFLRFAETFFILFNATILGFTVFAFWQGLCAMIWYSAEFY